MIRMGAMILAAVLLAKDGESRGRVVKVEETKLDGGQVKIVITVKTEKGEVRLHVPYGRTDDGWGIDPKLAGQARELDKGALVVIGWWDGDGVKIIKFIERINEEPPAAEPDKKDSGKDNPDNPPDKKKDEPAKKEPDKKKDEPAKKDGDKKPSEKDKQAADKKKAADAERAKDQQVRGVVVRVVRERNGEGEVVKVGVVIKFEKKEVTLWVPYKKVEGRWVMNKDLIKQIDYLKEGQDVTFWFYVSEEARFIREFEVHKDEPAPKDGDKK